MLRSKLIALTGALAFMVMAQSAGAANIAIQPGGDIGPAPASSMIVFSNTWNVPTNESADAWGWSVACTGCSILAYNVNYAFGAPSGPPGGAGNVLWQAPSFSVIQPTLPGVYNNLGSKAGTIGGFTPAQFAGNGLDVLIGWVTVHVTAAQGTVSPFFDAIDAVGVGGAPVPTSFTSTTWGVPEPGTALLFALGLGGLGIMGRRNR
jgi:hypothetical protein